MVILKWLADHGTGLTVLVGLIAVMGVYGTNRASSEAGAESKRLAEELAYYATGKESFIWLEVNGFGTDDAVANIKHEGQYPVRDIEIQVFDISDQMPIAKSGELKEFDLSSKLTERNLTVIHPTWNKKFNSFPLERNPKGDYYSYFINFDAHNDQHRQILELSKIDGVWRQGTRVQRGQGNSIENRILHFDIEWITAQPEIQELLKSLPDRSQSVPLATD